MSKRLVINYGEGRGYKTSGRGGRKFYTYKKGEERCAEKVLAMLGDVCTGDGGCKQF